MSTYGNCNKCAMGFQCGWSNIEPERAKKLDRSKMTNEPCKKLCPPASFTADDLDVDTVANILKATVDNSKDSFEVAIKRKRAATEKIKALKKVIAEEDKNIEEAAWFLPKGVRVAVGKATEEHYAQSTVRGSRHYNAYKAKILAKIERIEAEILDLSAERRAILDGLTSGTASFSLTPSGASDPHAFDDYAALTAELDALIDEIIKLRAQLKQVEKLKLKS